MMAPTFLNVGSTTGCTLADLKVTGYDAPYMNEDDEWEGGCAGDFSLQFLNNDGSVAARYYWIDDGEISAGWYANAGGKAIEGGAASVVIPAGVASWSLGKGMTLQSAGQVSAKDIAIKMNAKRNTACGNCMPVDIKLADFTVIGYEAPYMNEDDEWEGGCAGDFSIQILNNNGSVKARYYWVDDGEIAPGWYANAGGKAIEGGANSIVIPAGQGMWNIGNGMTLVIPSPISDEK